jgi:glycosyltransferase involved in cell wall biosynthesis
MNILVLTELYPSPMFPFRAAFNRQEFQALSDLGCRIRVITPIAWTDEVRRRLKRRGEPLERLRDSGPVRIAYPRYWYPPGAFRGTYGPLYLRAARRGLALLERSEGEPFAPDLIYGSYAYPDGWAAVALGRELKLPVVVKAHGSDLRRLAHPARKRRTVEAVRGADAVIAVSRDLADRAADLGADPDRIHLVYYGVQAQLFHPGDRAEARRRVGILPEESTVLAVGNLVPVKGPDLLIEAIAQLSRSGTPATCRFIGQGPMRPELERLAAKLGIADRVIFQGPQPLESLPDWYRAADILALASRSEGVPNVLLEGMACATRFVAASVGGIPEVAPWGTGELVAPEDPGALASGLRHALALARGSESIPAPRVPALADQMAQQLDILRSLASPSRTPASRP